MKYAAIRYNSFTRFLFLLAFTVMMFSIVTPELSRATEQPQIDHSTAHGGHAGHAEMGHASDSQVLSAQGVGVIHRVSRLNKMVKLTHEPIPDLNWPEMTMDLPVSDSVDLSSITTGEKIAFSIELGTDNRYIITNITKQ